MSPHALKIANRFPLTLILSLSNCRSLTNRLATCGRNWRTTLTITSPRRSGTAERFLNGTLLTPGGNPAGQCYRTPRDLFDNLHGVFRFTVDACASPDNALLPRYWTVEEDALRQDWSREIVFCNPPFANIGPFLAKARTAKRAVILAPLNFCTATGFHASPPDHLIAPDHRIRFVTGEELGSPVLGTALLVYGPLTREEKQVIGGRCFDADPLAPFLGKVHCADALDLLRRLPTDGGPDAVIIDPMAGSDGLKAQYDLGADPSGGDPDKHWYGDPDNNFYGHKVIHEECLRVLRPGGVLAWASALKYAGNRIDGNNYAGRNKEWFGAHAEWIITRRARHVWRDTPTQLWVVQSKEKTPIAPPASLNRIVYYDRLPQMPKGCKKHPCPKPPEELAVLIEALVRPGQVVLDCFCGLGSTLLASEELGCYWIGGDRSLAYCKFAMSQLHKLRMGR
jgi:phage N-6-adenine-methyltransferase